MLVCLACPKQNHLPPADAAPEDDDPLAISKPRPPSRDHIKSFTTQLKDIVMKFSTGAYRHCRPCNARNCHDQEDERRRSMDISELSSGELSPNDGHQFEESSPNRCDLLPTSFRRRSERSRNRNCGRTEIFLDDTSKFSARLRIRESPYRDRGRWGDQSEHSCGEEIMLTVGNEDEWVAQVEPGVMITFVALPDGHNHLKRIRFSRELFGKWRAQLWWAENCDKVHELYSVTRCEAPCDSPGSSTSSSIHAEDALRNTPEILSRTASPDRSLPGIADYFISNSAFDSSDERPGAGTNLLDTNFLPPNEAATNNAHHFRERFEESGDESCSQSCTTHSGRCTDDEPASAGVHSEATELTRQRDDERAAGDQTESSNSEGQNQGLWEEQAVEEEEPGDEYNVRERDETGRVRELKRAKLGRSSSPTP